MQTPASSPSDVLRSSPFRRILCAVQGTRGSSEAVRQASLLAGRDTHLTFLSVTYRQGVGASAMAEISPRRAAEALSVASRTAAGLGVPAETVMAEDRHAATRLLQAARDHDLLVLGAPPGPRSEGIALAETPTVALHRSPVPVLVARRPPGAFDFPRRIVVATDGTADSIEVVRTAIDVARAHDARVTLLHAGNHDDPETRHRIAEEAADLYEALDVEPVVWTDPGAAHRAIVEAAEREDASLVVTGSRGLRGIAAFASVSERVAHTAPCSVLVVRTGAEDGA